MRPVTKSAALAACLALTACGGGGGGGGGVISTPAPTPSPTPAPTPTPTPAPTPTPTPAPTPTPTPTPAATNSLITDLRASQTFTGEASTTRVTLSVPDGIVQTTAPVRDVVSVSYDAGSQSYTVTTAGNNQTFGPADIRTARYTGEAMYAKAGASEYLTLVTNPYYGSEFSNRYVGMGYWQKNALSAGAQQTSFSTFTYGLDTPASNVPRSGAAHWLTDIFGLFTTPGVELRTIQGLGDFEVDFAAAVFRATGYMNEVQVVSEGGTSGALTFQAGGQLTSGNSFRGLFTYTGSVYYPLYGTLSGSFFGPGADEIGATFNASNNGTVLTGALTGQRSTFASTSDGVHNISLINPLSSELLRGGTGGSVSATVEAGQPGFKQVTATSASVQVNFTNAGPGTAGFAYQYVPNPAEIVNDGRANFVTYKSTVAGSPVTVSYYKIGGANQELALTYSSFVTWAWGRPFGFEGSSIGNAFQAQYAVYGIPTPRDLMTGRTGTAGYDGVVYGKGASRAGSVYDISGASRFDVDFSNSSYNGWLDLRGTTLTGSSTDFGRFTFAAALAAGLPLQAQLVAPSTNFGGPNYIMPIFYGPSAQEIGGGFTVNIGNLDSLDATSIGGLTIAKMR